MQATPLSFALIVSAPLIAPTLDAYEAPAPKQAACNVPLRSAVEPPEHAAARHWLNLQCAREVAR